MATFDCAENLVCATLSGSDGIGVGVVTGTPNKIVVSASNIPNSALANSSININGTTIALGATGSLEIGDITDVNAGTNLTGGGSSGSVTLSLTSSITGGLDDISGINNIYTNDLTATNIQVLGTASIAMLNTINQQSLQIGDKYIIIMSGAIDHTTLSGSGILWGSGSTGPTYGPNGEHAYVRYDSVNDQLVIYPGLKVSGSITASNGGFSGSGANITNISTTNISNFNSAVQNLITGSSNITVTNGTASLNSNVIGLNSLTSSYLTGTIGVSGTLGLFNNLYTQYLEISKSSGIAAVELGGPTGAHIDLKNPFSDDYDLRIKSWGTEGGGEIRNWDGASIVLSGTNVGIGTTNPAQKLDVRGGTEVNAQIYADTAAATRADLRLRVNNSTGDSYVLFGDSATFDIGRIQYNYNSDYMALYTNSAEKLRITSAGNVGVGTTSPNYKLHVKDGSLILSSSANAASDTRVHFTQTTSSGYYDAWIGIPTWDAKTFFIYGPKANGSEFAASYADSTWKFATAGTTKMTIDSNGNVGIGTTNPGANLHVKGNGNVARLEGTDHAYIEWYPDGPTTRKAYTGFPSAAANYFIITNEINTGDGHVILQPGTSANVGIGTTNPNYKLEVNGTISGSAVYGLSGSSAQFPNFTNDVRAQFTAGTNITIIDGQISSTGGGSGTVLSGNAGYIAYYPSPGGTTVDDTTSIYTNAGNVGIGTTTLGSKLTVNGDISGSYLQLSTNIASSSANTNNLYANNIVKMWGKVKIASVGTSPQVTLLDGVNITDVNWTTTPDNGIIIRSALGASINDSGSFNSQINFLSNADYEYYITTTPSLLLSTYVSRSGADLYIAIYDPINSSFFSPVDGKPIYLDFNYFQRI